MGFDTLMILVLIGIPFFIISYRMIYVNKKNPITDWFVESRYIKVDEDDFPDIVQQSMRESKFLFVKINEQKTKIQAIVMPSIFSWSEIVKVKLIKEIKGYKVIFKSKCLMPVQVYAWGKNKRNADRFFSNLYKLLSY